MPLCGFNEKMLHGLRDFTLGLSLQTQKRMLEEGVSAREVCLAEINEMALFYHELLPYLFLDSVSLSGFNPKKLCALVLYAQSIYEDVLRKNEQGQFSPEHAFSEDAAETNILLVEIDRRYYDDYRISLQPPQAIKLLGSSLPRIAQQCKTPTRSTIPK